MKNLLQSGLKFLVVGGLSTIIELAFFNLFVLTGWLDPVAAKIVSSLIALVNAYLGNREWAFRDRRAHGRGVELALFVAVNVVCTALGAGIVAGGVAILDDPHALTLNAVNLVSIVIVVFVRFVLYRGIVFRSSPFVAPKPDAAPVPAAELRG